jgi:hypothetical protein
VPIWRAASPRRPSEGVGPDQGRLNSGIFRNDSAVIAADYKPDPLERVVAAMAEGAFTGDAFAAAAPMLLEMLARLAARGAPIERVEIG